MKSKNEGIFELRLADFGLAKFINEGEILNHKCGTPSYIAPEILRGSNYDFKADLFSLGSLFYNIVTKEYLFQSDDDI